MYIASRSSQLSILVGSRQESSSGVSYQQRDDAHLVEKQSIWQMRTFHGGYRLLICAKAYTI
jgi:hypothetical protein